MAHRGFNLLVVSFTLALGIQSHGQTFRKIVLSDQFFSEGANVADFNGDGKTDVVAGPFWYEGPAFSKRHQYGPGDGRPLDPHGYSKNFLAFTDDINHDGRPDILIVGFPGEAGLWYENPGGSVDQKWAEHVVLDHVDNESPGFEDVNGDGVRDLLCITEQQFGWAGRDAKDANAKWTFHPVCPKNSAYQRFTHGIGAGDVNGDGRVDLIDKDGWWEQPEKLDGDPMWTRHEFPFAEAGAQMCAVDLTGDKRADIISSFNAHGYGLNWFEQTDSGKFEKHAILGAKPADNPQGVCFSQLHAIALADVNGDGLADIVTGKRYWAHGPDKDPEPNAPAVLYWFEAHKNPATPNGIEFIPHQIDDNSGVGTQVVASDVNGDGRQDIIVGNKKGAFVFIQEATPSPGTPGEGRGEGLPAEREALAKNQGPRPNPLPEYRERGQEKPPARDPFTENIRSTEAQTPEQEQKSLHLPDGFVIQLVASDPDIAKPMNMQFDARGRLWLTETVEYPLPAHDRKGQDKIKIIEIGENGRAKKITTFAENLNIPIGIYPYRDGCIAFSVPEIRRYFDDNGDGKSDRSELLYGTFGQNDTHGITNGFRRGFDGWLYACHGFNNLSKITAKDGSSITLESGNTYRMRVDGSRVEQFTWGQTNPFGLSFDPLGNIYSADSHSKPVYQLTRGGYYEGINKTDDGLGFGPAMMQHTHGSTAIAGVLYYEADQFPKEFRGNTFNGNVVTGRVNRDTLTFTGSSPIAHEADDLVKSDDPWFRPVDIQLGPDGAIYVADFYNRIIGHYEVALDHPQRDHQRGRIWRIVYTGNGKPPKPSALPRDLSALNADELIELLGDPNLTLRRIATDELCDRLGEVAINPLKKALTTGDANPTRTVQVLWALHRLKSLDREPLMAAAHSADATVRTHAMRIYSETPDWTPADREIVIGALHDENPQVRRCAADALAQHPAVENLSPLLEFLQATPAEDVQLRYQARVALRNQLRESGLIAKLDSLKLTEDQLRQLLDITPAVPSSEAAVFEIAHLNLSPHESLVVTKLLKHAVKYAADAGTVDAAVAAVQRALADDVELQLELFGVVQQSAQERGGAISDSVRQWGTDLARRAVSNSDQPKRLSDASRGRAAEIAQSLGLKELGDPLRQLGGDSRLNADARTSVLLALASFCDADSFKSLGLMLSDANSPPPLREKISSKLAALDSDLARQTLIAAIPTVSAQSQKIIASSLAHSATGGEALLVAITSSRAPARLLQEPTIRDALLAANVANAPERIAKLTKSLPALKADLPRVLEQRRAAFANAQKGKRTSSERGAKVFTTSCAACHQIDGQGRQVGPQLDGIGARGVERVMEDLLDPSRNVDPAFRYTTFMLKNGDAFTGLYRRQEADDVQVYIDALGKEVSVRPAEVKKRIESNASLMPDNFATVIVADDFNDLMEFLLAHRNKSAK